jgi:hypothetical protein
VGWFGVGSTTRVVATQCIAANQTFPLAVIGEKCPRAPWQEIASDVTRETDPNRVLELVEELNAALQSQTTRKPPQPAIKAA